MNTILLLMLQATLGASPVSETGKSFDSSRKCNSAEQNSSSRARAAPAGGGTSDRRDFVRILTGFFQVDVVCLGGEGDSGVCGHFSQPIEIGGKRTKRIRRLSRAE